MKFLPWILLAMAAVCNGIGALLIKYSQREPDAPMLQSLLGAWFLSGVALFGLTLLIITYVLRSLPVAVAYPAFVALSQVVVGVGAISIGERANMGQVAGIALAMTGVCILVVSSDAGQYS